MEQSEEVEVKNMQESKIAKVNLRKVRKRKSSSVDKKISSENLENDSQKLSWKVAFIFSFIGCSFMIFEIYKKWQMSPPISNVGQENIPIRSIPFPAVTICPVTKAHNISDDFAESLNAMSIGNFDNLTIEEMKFIEAIAHVCPSAKKFYSQPGYFGNDSIFSELKEDEIFPTLQEISLQFEDYYFAGSFINKEMFEEHFSRAFTKLGFCSTFNVLKLSEILKLDK